MQDATRMPPKKKGESALKQDTAGQGVEDSEHPGSDSEALLQREYDKLTDTLNNLKRKVEKLRRENEFLQNEANQTRMESQEYMSYMSKRTQKRQSAIVTLSDQNHQAQENLKRQREENLDKYQEQANELKKEILEKENELALLNIEIAELREFKSLQQQQLGRIAELEREVTSMHCRHSESLQALKAGFLSEKERYEAQAKQKIQALALAANREASRCLMSHTRAVSLENQHLREELQQLIQRAHSLRGLQDQLQAQRQQLLLEREYVRELRRLRATPGPTPQGSHTRPLGVDSGREDTRRHRTADT
ncbi:coiled-coil domain-containing protein 166 isoform X1 [Oncorhynchus keta]|uniref:coiled-coil domain-containing protein 166 isoform X1 n=2 Tax=Oncorhynchus keta TaxID=8018 RepID=UPI0015FD1C02|nr:coiled-coil domain-containing protein 166 isoform X1 [Oncorhynchus keta]